LKPSHAVQSSIAICALALATSCSVPQQVPNPQAAGNLQVRAHKSSGSGYEVLFSFHGLEGAYPQSDLLAYGGGFFGTAPRGGGSRNGTIYKIGLDGKERVLHRFAGGTDGSHPVGGLTELGGTLYGTTTEGGGSGCQGYGGCGTIFSISPSGASYTVIHAFGGPDGAQPNSDMTVLSGTLYGTTQEGGAAGTGTVFTVNPSQGFKSLYSFQKSPDANGPTGHLAVLNGTIYGATIWGGDYQGFGYGAVFSITPDGSEKVIYSCRDNGDCWGPHGGVTLLNGKLYATSYEGGASIGCCGSVFSVTPGGKEHTVYDFRGGSDSGTYPTAPLTVHGGVLYGATEAGGNGNDAGTLFSLTPAGSMEILYRFCGFGECGEGPTAALTYFNGELYSTLSSGGTYGKGLLYSLTP
jgi:uncharacterized repeat protein (TIGR03803 family)